MNRFLLLALVMLLPLGLVACSGDDDDNANRTKKVTFMLEWTPNTNHAGIFIAKDKGYYLDEGIEIEIVEPAAGGVDQVVASGKADFGISVQENIMPARAEGLPIVSIAAIIQHNTSSLMSLKRDGITRPRDMNGKTYGGFGGALESAIIKKLSECDGGDPDSIKFVDVGDVDYLVGMDQDLYDFAWIFDGWDGVRAKEVEKVDVNTLPFIDYTRCIPDWYTPVITTNEALIKNDPELVKRFMKATARGYEDAINDPNASYDAILKNAPETDKALLKASAKYLQDKYVDRGRQWGLQDESTWVSFQKFLRESGLAEKDIDVTKAYSNEFLPK